MAKRLYMTNADYVAIAVSPALIMALVGSLIFFLIEVLYVGQYQARLNYAFALFVFAAVLIGRISIELGSERATLFALPLGIAMFLFLVRFVEHPSQYSHVINLALMGVVWWCAHKLTWDCTLIDDEQDASGEGLMQRIGVDGPDSAKDEPSAAGATANELLERPDEAVSGVAFWWQRLTHAKAGPHTPGLWVLYFSLAALPLFGIGQHWIPVADVGRRRYAFFLLLVYVSAALALLVTTSFLGLRRYLRQRRIEMPAPIAATWVTFGAALIALVMFIAALIPRPAAEVAISRVPWQAGSSANLSSSRVSVGDDGTNQQGGAATRSDTESDESTAESSGQTGKSNAQSGGEQQGSESSQASESSKPGKSSQGQSSAESSQSDSESGKPAERGENPSGDRPPESTGQQAQNETSQIEAESTDQSTKIQVPEHSQPSNPVQIIQNLSSSFSGLASVLKLLFYAVAALLVAYLIWKYRRQLVRAIADMLQQLRDLIAGLFGVKRAADQATAEVQTSAAQARFRRFADFRDPFATGEHHKIPPDELVRYTFAAFEAWANDHGCPRTPDRTPHELIRSAVAAESPMYGEARRMVRLYSELAYASRRVSRESASELAELWTMMRRPESPVAAASTATRDNGPA